MDRRSRLARLRDAGKRGPTRSWNRGGWSPDAGGEENSMPGQRPAMRVCVKAEMKRYRDPLWSWKPKSPMV